MDESPEPVEPEQQKEEKEEGMRYFENIDRVGLSGLVRKLGQKTDELPLSLCFDFVVLMDRNWYAGLWNVFFGCFCVLLRKLRRFSGLLDGLGIVSAISSSASDFRS
jgi:hypothetical protein